VGYYNYNYNNNNNTVVIERLGLSTFPWVFFQGGVGVMLELKGG